MADPTQTKPRHRASRLELEIDSLAQGGRGVARADGYVVFVSGALPGDRVRARLTKAKRAFAEAQGRSRCCARARSGSPSAAFTAASPARAPRGRGCPTSASSARRRTRSTTRCAASAASRASSSSRSSRPSSRGATATSSSTRSASATDRLALGFHRRGSWAEIDRRRGLPARLGAPTTRPATQSASGRRRERSPPTTSAPQTGVLRNLVVREGRRTGQLQTRLVTSPGRASPRPPVDLHTVDRGTGRRHRRPDRGARRRVPRRGALRPALPRLPLRLLPDQHRDGGAPLRDRRASTPG